MKSRISFISVIASFSLKRLYGIHLHKNKPLVKKLGDKMRAKMSRLRKNSIISKAPTRFVGQWGF